MALQFQLCLLHQAASLLSPTVTFLFLTSQTQPPPFTKPQHTQRPFPPPASPDLHICPFGGQAHSAALVFFRDKQKRQVFPEAGNQKFLQHGPRSCSKPAALHPVTDPEQGVCEHGFEQLARCVGTPQWRCWWTPLAEGTSGASWQLCGQGRGRKGCGYRQTTLCWNRTLLKGVITWRKSATGFRVTNLTSFKSQPKGRVVTEILNVKTASYISFNPSLGYG